MLAGLRYPVADQRLLAYRVPKAVYLYCPRQGVRSCTTSSIPSPPTTTCILLRTSPTLRQAGNTELTFTQPCSRHWQKPPPSKPPAIRVFVSRRQDPTSIGQRKGSKGNELRTELDLTAKGQSRGTHPAWTTHHSTPEPPPAMDVPDSTAIAPLLIRRTKPASDEPPRCTHRPHRGHGGVSLIKRRNHRRKGAVSRQPPS